MQVLDDIGGASDKEKRKAYFKEIDEDGSRAIDFEEFMEVLVIHYFKACIQIYKRQKLLQPAMP